MHIGRKYSSGGSYVDKAKTIFTAKNIILGVIFLIVLVLLWWEIELIVILARRGTIPENLSNERRNRIRIAAGEKTESIHLGEDLLKIAGAVPNEFQQPYPGYLPFDDQFVQEYALLHKNITSSANPRVIIFRAGSTYYGGLGDRVHGVLSCFLIGLLTNRAVIIDMEKVFWHSFVFSPYFDTTYDIIYENVKSAKYIHLMDSIESIAEDLKTKDLNEVWKENTLVMEINEPVVQYLYENPYYRIRLLALNIHLGANIPVVSDMHPKTIKLLCSPYDNTLGSLYRIIAYPNGYLLQKLNKYLEFEFGTTNLCFHFRFGGSKGESSFKNDWKYSTKETWFWDCAEKYRKTTQKWFIASDSNSIINDISDVEGSKIIYVKGIPKHHNPKVATEHTSINEEEMKKLFADHFLLSECDSAIISQSSFSRTAIYRSYYCPHIFADDNNGCENPIDLPRKGIVPFGKGSLAVTRKQ